MTAIMEKRVPTFIMCILLLVSMNLTYVIVMGADIGYGASEFIYTSSGAKKEWERIKRESEDWWNDFIEPRLEVPPYKVGDPYITLTEAYEMFEAKWGFRKQDPEITQYSDYWKSIGTGIGDQFFVKQSEFDENQIKVLEEGGMPEMIGFLLLLFNVILGVVLAIIVWSFIYDGLSLIPFVGR